MSRGCVGDQTYTKLLNCLLDYFRDCILSKEQLSYQSCTYTLPPLVLSFPAGSFQVQLLGNSLFLPSRFFSVNLQLHLSK